MKKNAVIAVIFFLFSCVPANYNFTFINDSTAVTVTVSPDPAGGQTWSAFSLAPGATSILVVPSPYCWYVYDNQNQVTADDRLRYEVHFLDNINYPPAPGP
jgi:hypothetical protein